MITDDDIAQAWARIARTDDGRLIYVGLQKILCGVAAAADDGTLRENNGRRMFAAELMAKMAESIEASASGGSKPNERPVVFAIQRPAIVARRRIGAERRGGAAEPDAEPA